LSRYSAAKQTMSTSSSSITCDNTDGQSAL